VAAAADAGAEGVLLSQGTAAGGYPLYVKDARLHYVHNYVGRAEYEVVSADPLPRAGTSSASSSSRPVSRTWPPGRGAPRAFSCTSTVPWSAKVGLRDSTVVLNPGALACGTNPGSSVTGAYPSPYKFTGTIHTVKVDVSGELIHHPEAELRVQMARQ
jgi:arylsulfatase